MGFLPAILRGKKCRLAEEPIDSMTAHVSTRPDTLCDTRWDGPHGIARFGKEVIRRLPGATALPRGLRLFHPLDPLWLSMAIAKIAPRVYFTPGFNPPLISTKPFVFVIHDLNYVHCPENSDALRRMYFHAVVRPACRKAARVLTVSQFSRQQILEWGRVPDTHVTNVSNGVDPQFHPDGPRHMPGYPYVLYVGNRLPHKNLPRLFAAFAAARVDCKLLLTGKADAATDRLARECGIADDVCFAGMVDEADMPALYRGASALVLPSFFEGFGLPVIEAMACGVPVLTSDVTSLPEIAADAAVLIDPKSVESIADGLRRITHDESLRRSLIARGLHRATSFSWETTAAAIRDVLRSAS